ncbi:DUF1697 domain-containing protein [Microbacterium sp. GXF7504]
MTTWLAFLRAINLGATRVFPKDAIVAATAAAGFDDVATHLNTGNVRLGTAMRSRARVEAALERAYLADRGFEVPVIAFRADEFAELARDAAELSATRTGLDRHYVYLLKEELDAKAAAAVEARSDERGEMVVRGRAVHALLRAGYTPGQVDPLGAARMLGVATNRNLSVVTALAERWC